MAVRLLQVVQQAALEVAVAMVLVHEIFLNVVINSAAKTAFAIDLISAREL